MGNIKTFARLALATLLVLALALVLPAAVAAQSVPVTIDKVEIDDVDVAPGGTVRLDVERGDELSVRVRVTVTQDISNLEIRGFISGFEFNDIADEDLHDVTQVFDARANVSYVRKLNFALPREVQVDNYKLRIVVADRFGDQVSQSYNLLIDAPRHELNLLDVILSPGWRVKAGSAVLATVRVENLGQQEEDDVRVTVRIPKLGVSGTEYIDRLRDDDDQEETEEIFLRLPRCAEAGTYELVTEAVFQRGRRTVTDTQTIEIVENEACAAPDMPPVTVTLGSQLQTIQAKGSGVFPITIANNAKLPRQFTLSVTAPEGLSVQVAPSNTIVLDAGKSQTLYVYVSDAGAASGAHVITAALSSAQEQLEQFALTVTVEGKRGATARQVLEVILIILVVILVILGLVVAISRLRGPDEGPVQTYY